MVKISSCLRLAPWLAGIAGLLLGVAARGIFREPAPETSSGARRPDVAPSAQNRPPATSAAMRNGPVTRLLRELSGASAEQCEELVRAHLESPESGRGIELEAIFRRWMTLEAPERILERFPDENSSAWRAEFSAAFFRAWAAFDEAVAMDASRHRGRFAAAQALFAIENGYPGFTDYLSRGMLSLSSESKARLALTALGRDRPEIACGIAAANLAAGEKASGIEAVARGWAGDDPQAAFDWLRSLQLDGVNLTKAFDAVFGEWMKRDLPAAQAAFELSGLKSLPGRSTGIFGRPRDAGSQLRLALESTPFMNAAALYHHLSESDIDWEKANFILPSVEHDGWRPVDPASAAEEIAKLPPGEPRDYLMGCISHLWLTYDRDAALDFAERHGIRSQHLDRVRGEPDEEMRRTAREAPEETFAALFDTSENAPDDLVRDHLYDLALEWSARDPEASAEWLLTQPVPEGWGAGGADAQRTMLFQNALGFHWARQDAASALLWLESLPGEDPALRAKAWRAMEHYVTVYSPDLSFAMSAALLEEESRSAFLEKQLNEVRNRIGHGAALELLKNPDLSAAESAALAEVLRNPVPETQR